MRKILAIVAAMLLAMTVIVPAQAADESGKTTIKLGAMVWDGIKSDTYVAKHVLEDMGYNVDITEFSEWGIAFAALSKGDIQVLGVHINYVAQPYYDRYKQFLEKLSPFSYGLYQAIAVPDYMNIDTTAQLNDVADKIDGKIIGIESGAGLMREARKALKVYKLDKIKLVEGSTPAMTAALTSAISRKAPIAVTMWTPFWPMQKFPIKFLKDPKHAFSPPDTYTWVAKKGFAAAHPRAREVLASIYIPMSATLKMMGFVKDGATVPEAAEKWVKQNQDLVKRWENIKKY